MLVKIATYLHFGNETKFKNKKEFTKIKKRLSIQKEHDNWMNINCTFSYNQIFDAESGEMQEPYMFFGDLKPIEMGTTEMFENWHGGNYYYDIFKVDESEELDAGTYICVKPAPQNIPKVGKPMDMDGTYECRVFVFKDWKTEFIFNIYGAAICSYRDGSEVMFLGEYQKDEDDKVYTDWNVVDWKINAKQEDYVSEAEGVEDIENWNEIFGELPLAPPANKD